MAPLHSAFIRSAPCDPDRDVDTALSQPTTVASSPMKSPELQRAQSFPLSQSPRVPPAPSPRPQRPAASAPVRRNPIPRVATLGRGANTAAARGVLRGAIQSAPARGRGWAAHRAAPARGQGYLRPPGPPQTSYKRAQWQH